MKRKQRKPDCEFLIRGHSETQVAQAACWSVERPVFTLNLAKPAP